MRGASVWGIGVLAAALLPAAVGHAAMDRQSAVTLDVYGALASYDGLDEDLSGGGLRVEGAPGPLLLRLEGEMLRGQDTDVEARRAAGGIGVFEPWTEHTGVVAELGARHLNPDESSSLTDYSLEFGLRGWTAGAKAGGGFFRGDLRGVVLYPEDSDRSSQAGGRLEFSGAPDDFQYLSLLIRGEVLSDEYHAAIGIRGRF
ncbi:hypothetical protein [Halorhodospira sp. 9621]|uniref:hypothetical protein n=1 Tax=Halorhodospira sp. 9621 TaxID=2899135 RepID=UPI001EE91FD0|nr:hypothetical protein [Halorhodospira sp. 9621]